MAKAQFQPPGLSIAEIENILAQQRYQAADYSSATEDQQMRIDQAITAAGQAASTWGGQAFWWSRKLETFDLVCATISTTSRTSNVTTVTTAAAHGLVVDCRVQIAGVTDTTFNDHDAVVASVPSTTTFTYSNTGSNGTSSSGTVAGHAYPIRTINSAVMTDLYAIEAVRVGDDWELWRSNKEYYDDWMRFYADGGTGTPYNFALWGDLMMGVIPIPDAAETLAISYILRHSKITNVGSLDTALIVPAEYHYPVYVDGGLWLLRHETTNPVSLSQCEPFIDAMMRMNAADPSRYYSYADRAGYPANRRVWERSDGVYLTSGDL